MNACVGCVDLANPIRFNPMDALLANGMSVALLAAMLPQLRLLRTVCIQATGPHFCTGAGAEQDRGDPHAMRAGCTCCNLLAGAASVRNVDTSVVMFGVSVGGGVALALTS